MPETSDFTADASPAQGLDGLVDASGRPMPTEYRIPCPGHPLGDHASLLLRRRHTDHRDAWCIVNPAWPVGGENVWTGRTWEYLGDVGPAQAYRYTEDQALALAPRLAREETARMLEAIEQLRRRPAGDAAT
ncbi:hypothetical protein ACGF12_13600 [Kitasatospora sp. NPDC048296]|uniref:hypothetical protein n=1 Tax=Kitasatospora sp. NPDC048296 TaxID=3364048 RepID=UPI0037152C83